MSTNSFVDIQRDAAHDQRLFTDLTVALIAHERIRQIEHEGYSAQHDDSLESAGELALAAACYAMAAAQSAAAISLEPMAFWPWSIRDWKPRDAEANLVRAGALIVAELERVRRANDAQAAARASTGGETP